MPKKDKEGEMRWYLVALLMIASLFLAATVEAQPPTPPAVDLTQGFSEHIIHVWSLERSSPAGQELLRQLRSRIPGLPEGKQSRDIGDQILEAALRGDVKAYPACFPFRFEFFDVTAGTGPVPVWVNGKQESFDPARPELRIDECGTEPPDQPVGVLAVPVNPQWNSRIISAEIHSPFMAPFRYYPSLSHSLKMCGPKTKDRCGGPYDPNQPTLLSQRLAVRGITHYHFVVK